MTLLILILLQGAAKSILFLDVILLKTLLSFLYFLSITNQ